MASGHRLNTSIVLAAVHGLSGLFRAVSAVEPSLFRLLPPPVPVPNKPPRFCGRKAKYTLPSALSFKKWCTFGGFYAPYNTCEPGDSHCKRSRSLFLCLLLCVWRLSITVDAPFSLGVSLSMEEPTMVGVRKDSLQKYFDHLGLGGLKVAGKIIITSNEHILGTCYATKCTRRCIEWNITPKVSPRLSHQIIPSIQSNNGIIPTGHPQHTIKPHFHSVSIVIFHTAHRATGSSSLLVYSKQYRISF